MKLAVPGEFGGIVEEIAPGENTFEENGAVYSYVVGVPVVDKAKRALGVKAVKQVKPLRKGDVVTAVVSELYDKIAQVEILSIEGDARTALGSTFAYIRISELQSGYVEQLRDHIKIGDVLRAKVIEVTDLGTYLSIAYPEYGVVSALCSRCRGDTKRTGSTFTCIDCGSVEMRKTAVT